MNKGFYRGYFHIGRIGFKFARISFNDGNPFLGFMTSIIMNVLERKRYRYYCCGKTYRQWGRKWKYNGEIKPIFCPTYFTCGLFNIVKHLKTPATVEDLDAYTRYHYKDKKIKKHATMQQIEEQLDRDTRWLCRDIKADNFRFDEYGNLKCIDYGHFTLGNTHAQCACLIDYA